jgi:metal-responsive CopG/Arc/MetJ family transcriptional regulator
VANQPKTPQRSIRIDDELWTAAQAVAQANQESVSDIIRTALRHYITQPPGINCHESHHDAAVADDR